MARESQIMRILLSYWGLVQVGFATLILFLAAGSIFASEHKKVVSLQSQFGKVTLSASGESAVLIGSKQPIVGFLKGDKLLEWRVPSGEGNSVIGAFQFSGSQEYIVVAVDREVEAITRFFIVDSRNLTGRVLWELSNFNAETAILTNHSRILVAGRDHDQIRSVDICAVGNLKEDQCGDFWSTRELKYESLYADIPVESMVADPASSMVIATHVFGSFSGIDLKYGKTLFREQISKSPSPFGIAGAISQSTATVFLSEAEEGLIRVLDIDRSSRYWNQVSVLYVDKVGKTNAPVIDVDRLVGKESNGQETENQSRLRALVSSSSNQNAILIGGNHNEIYALARNGNAFAPRLNIRSRSRPIIDFDISDDGETVALLFGQGVLVIPFSVPSQFDTRGNGGGNESKIAAAVQKRLVELGYYVGVIDGTLNEDARGALARFIGDRSIKESVSKEATDVGVETLARLFLENLESLPQNALGKEKSDLVYRKSFELFLRSGLGNNVRHFRPRELYTLGLKNDRGEDCWSYNTYPPHNLWSNILPIVQALDDLREEIGQPIKIRSVYQTARYGECAGTPSEMRPAHNKFAAAEFSVPKLAAKQVISTVHMLAKKNRNLEYTIVGDDHRLFLATMGTVARHLDHQIGDWHAIVASYSTNADGCREAKDDVNEFARLLSNSDLSGLKLYVARTAISNNYAVTVDTGSSQAKARKAVRRIRAVSSRSADGKTGKDTFVQRNRGWRIDDECNRLLAIP